MPGVGIGRGPSIVVEDGQTAPAQVYIDGKLRWWKDLTDAQKATWRARHPGGEPAGSPAQDRAKDQFDQSLEKAGISNPNETGGNLLQALSGLPINTNDPELQRLAQTTQQQYNAGVIDEQMVALIASGVASNPKYLKTSPYLEKLELAGFDGPYSQDPLSQYGPGATAVREGGVVPPKLPPFRESDQGWIQFANGVLVGPNGEVEVDPTSDAPLSPSWQRGIKDWSPEKIKEWKNTLVKYGYLTKDQAKSAEVTTGFIGALRLYHQNRYLNGGEPIANDDPASAGPERPKPVDLEDFSAQIRNDVREQYERIYGQQAGDGEVEMWSNYIIRQGMQMQRRNIRKYDTADTSGAAAEAEERFIEKLEHTPQARLLRESEEENTQMRDTFTRMAQVTDSLTT